MSGFQKQLEPVENKFSLKRFWHYWDFALKTLCLDITVIGKKKQHYAIARKIGVGLKLRKNVTKKILLNKSKWDAFLKLFHLAFQGQFVIKWQLFFSGFKAGTRRLSLKNKYIVISKIINLSNYVNHDNREIVQILHGSILKNDWKELFILT